MNVLVIAEHDNRSLKGSTLNTLGAAAQRGGEVHLLVAGLDCGGADAEAAALPGVSKVLVADADAYQHQLAESLSRLVADLGKNYTHILAPAGSAGKNLMPRVAALLDVAQLSDIVGLVPPSTFRRPIYAGIAIATVQSLDPVVVATVRVSAFDPQPAQGGDATIQTLDVVHETGTVRFVGEELAVSDRPDLGSARIVVSGGRGLGSGENFALIESLADKLGAAVGASRAAVDAGFVANDRQVGQTGKIVAPELYVAVGISGAIQHLAGMKDSKVIVAINKDEEAPIFQVADYGLVADLFEAVPELERAL